MSILFPSALLAFGLVLWFRRILETKKRLPAWDRFLQKFWMLAAGFVLVANVFGWHWLADVFWPLVFCLLLATVWFLRDYRPARLFALALIPVSIGWVLRKMVWLVSPDFFQKFEGFWETVESSTELWMLGFGIYASIQNTKEQKQRRKEEEQLRAAEARKAELEALVAERTAELTEQKTALEKTLAELKSAQTQLIHSEKMASLGELTAGIAHEIQNPLNFVNNFSELSVELAEELKEEIGKLEIPEKDRAGVAEILGDLALNQQKINHHGKRAASIVSGMLQHARTSTGKKEPTDLNALADEYLRLAYHGLRAKDKTFNAKLETDFDPNLGKVEVVPQDFGRVLLNLLSNAFYAVQQKANGSVGVTSSHPDTTRAYHPTVSIFTKKIDNQVVIKIRDNGTGMPEDVKAKIFQPFFTTKPTGQGTGLGLSLAFDIVTKGHGGTMGVESEAGEGTVFIIQIPLSKA